MKFDCYCRHYQTGSLFSDAGTQQKQKIATRQYAYMCITRLGEERGRNRKPGRFLAHFHDKTVYCSRKSRTTSYYRKTISK